MPRRLERLAQPVPDDRNIRSSSMLRTVARIILASSLAAICPAGGAHAQSPQKLKIAEVVTAIGGDRVGALILSGQADVGLAGPEVAIYLYNSEAPDKPVMFCSVNGTDGFFFVSREKIEPFDWSKLRNRKIIGWRPG